MAFSFSFQTSAAWPALDATAPTFSIVTVAVKGWPAVTAAAPPVERLVDVPGATGCRPPSV